MVLSLAWARALALAWDSYRAGTTPVGAVVVDPTGAIVAEGRGRRFEPPSFDAQLAGTHIAHAEVNALALLPPTRRYEEHTLLTTLEPCCMCLGAAMQSTFTDVRYAAPDPYAGSAHLVVDTPQARRRPLRCTGPLPDQRATFAEVMHVCWLLDVPVADVVLQVHEDARPEAFALAVRHRFQLHAARDANRPWHEAMAIIA